MTILHSWGFQFKETCLVDWDIWGFFSPKDSRMYGLTFWGFVSCNDSVLLLTVGLDDIVKSPNLI